MKGLFLCIFIFASFTANSQSISSEEIKFQLVKTPKNILEPTFRNYTIQINSPYDLTVERVIAQAESDYQFALDNYDEVVRKSEVDYQQALKNIELDEERAREKFEKENEAFEKLTLVERMVLIDQGKKPRLSLPNRPEFHKPTPPVYKEPNLNDYIIVDNEVLASKISVAGFNIGNPNLEISIHISSINFQDNAGQTYANQPVNLIIKENGVEKINENYFDTYQFISSVPSNNINKTAEEKKHLDKIIQFLNQFINELYGYPVVDKSVHLEVVKNNRNKHDNLERAHIYVTTNLKKLQPEADSQMNIAAIEGIKKGTDIWQDTLKKVDFKNSKSDLNAKIGRYIYMNLIRVNLALDNKQNAESLLNKMQEQLIYMKLSNSEERELSHLEKEIYTRN